MIRFLIHKPIAVFMVTLALLLLGIVASQRIPTSLLPDIDIPEITVQLSYPNNTARILETNIVRPLRNQLLQVANLVDIETQARDGIATLTLRFAYGTNTDYAFIETNEKVDAALNQLPRDMKRPTVLKASATDIPILNLTVSLTENYTSARFLALSEFAETVIKKRIEQQPDIALADMSGQAQPEIIITPYQDKLISLGISNELLATAIQRNNFELGNLTIQNGIYQYNFLFSNPLRTKENIEDIYLNIYDKLFQLKELAHVSIQPKQERGLAYANGKRVIVLAIIKQADARMYELKASVEKLIQAFEKEYPDVHFTTNQDQTKLLQLSIDNLKSSLWIGSILAILIMFFFLKDFKSPLIIAISIPTSLIISLLFLYLSGRSINIISLSGLILGVGMMIDNSIIVIDNITQKLEAGLNLVEACAAGTNEIISPLISAVLTTCSVFLPLLFLSGITGTLFFDQALAVSIGLGTSLLVSIFLIPPLYKQLKSKKIKVPTWFRIPLQTQVVENWYEKGYRFFFAKKWIVYGISILSICVAIVLFNVMKYEQLPEITQNETILTIDWNEQINVTENQRRIQTIVQNIPTLETTFAQIGEQQFLLQRENIKSLSEASVYLKTTTPKELTIVKERIRDLLLEKYTGSTYSFNKPKTIFEYIFNTKEETLVAEVFSKGKLEVPEEEKVKELTQLLDKKNTVDIPLQQTAVIQIIHENVALYDVNYNSLINELKAAFSQNFIDDLKTAKKFIPIKLNYNVSNLENVINRLFVKNTNGADIPIKNLLKIQRIQQYKTITANRNGEYLSFPIQSEANTKDKMKTIANTFKEHPDVNVRFSGSWAVIQELKKELLVVIVIAILLLYFIMVAQFESLWQPLIILLEIPIDIGGALLLLWLFGESINIMAVIGIIVMCGVIINDSILKIHTINLLKKQGLSIEDAIKTGGKLRIKPIVMTSLTTILALLPFLFMSGLGATLQKPLALTVIGGMLIGTFISLYFIPLLYSYLHQKFEKLH
ncbi:efflux RND transporter permease subunit [Kordia sp. YSTF-M3]|uniref:Efflux RND transporter permease subunit n=1 Tax=Kordia aestuariivivens TaxID=2759037 RepID=A0ABR7Q6X5_9FLAO|nr:efflux RND transporter permease subunit [Kordia aestuariivivens]MBC8754293.1 efflux RND transporter permease subunit [Kordia aestuariivivens]